MQADSSQFPRHGVREFTKENDMNADATKPHDGETLTAWVNRTRPEGAPEVKGEPVFNPGSGFAWNLLGGWTVQYSFDPECDAVGVAGWSMPDGHALLAVAVHTDGRVEVVSEETCATI